MTPQHEEALRCRLTPYAVEFRYDDDGMSDLVSPQEFTLWVEQVLVWAEGCVAAESQS